MKLHMYYMRRKCCGSRLCWLLARQWGQDCRCTMHGTGLAIQLAAEMSTWVAAGAQGVGRGCCRRRVAIPYRVILQLAATRAVFTDFLGCSSMSICLGHCWVGDAASRLPLPSPSGLRWTVSAAHMACQGRRQEDRHGAELESSQATCLPGAPIATTIAAAILRCGRI